MRHDSVLSSSARSGRSGILLALFRRVRAFPARGYIGAAFAAVLTGIVVNALTLQHERHPAPFFAARQPVVVAPTPPTPPAAPPPAAAATTDEPTVATVLPPQRPANLGTVAEPAPTAHVGDANKDAQKQILAAQNALIKLGYTLKADGSPGSATLAALRDFERAHSLPLSTDVTPHLLRQLTAAANAAAR
jgi:Putative peptidoglycan binding domain